MAITELWEACSISARGWNAGTVLGAVTEIVVSLPKNEGKGCTVRAGPGKYQQADSYRCYPSTDHCSPGPVSCRGASVDYHSASTGM